MFPSQPFVKEPRTAGILAEWRMPAPGFDGLTSSSRKEAGKEFKVDFFVLEPKFEMACKIVRRLVAGAICVLDKSIAFAAHASGADQRFDTQGLSKRNTVELGERFESYLHCRIP
ncbi:hypothetical protein D9M71_522410 [compost metagenome]